MIFMRIFEGLEDLRRFVGVESENVILRVGVVILKCLRK